ncbi:MAG TPA: substrate-binding domain-containing protein, partial [Bacillota bacterium]|nr:substrate-binding domain-containing protein [Bacillota bacterium]
MSRLDNLKPGLVYLFCLQLIGTIFIAGRTEAAPSVRKTAGVQNRPLVIAIVPKSLDNPVFVDAKEAAELTAQKLSVTLEWVAPFKVNPELQVKLIEGLIRKKVDGIAVSVSDPAKLRRVIAKAVSAGIKVATMDSDAPGSGR